jgi:hypothetical protein
MRLRDRRSGVKIALASVSYSLYIRGDRPSRMCWHGGMKGKTFTDASIVLLGMLLIGCCRSERKTGVNIPTAPWSQNCIRWRVPTSGQAATNRTARRKIHPPPPKQATEAVSSSGRSSSARIRLQSAFQHVLPHRGLRIPPQGAGVRSPNSFKALLSPLSPTTTTHFSPPCRLALICTVLQCIPSVLISQVYHITALTLTIHHLAVVWLPRRGIQES